MKIRTLGAAACAAMILLTGCGSVESQVCNRLDECNALDDWSIDECTEDWADTLEDMSSSEESDCRDDLKDCLDNESCDNFLSCEINCPSE